MIDVDRYHILKEKYSRCSSWAIWRDAGEKPASNTGDITIFNDKNICDKLNDKYVFVGLNVSSTPEDEPWRNFHSDYRYQKDFKLRYALKDTRFWGSYITDIIKDCPLKTSSDVKKYLKNNPQKIIESVQTLKEELGMLSDKKPILIAMGNASFDILNKNLTGYDNIKKIRHYAYPCSKEKYRGYVLNKLEGI